MPEDPRFPSAHYDTTPLENIGDPAPCEHDPAAGCDCSTATTPITGRLPEPTDPVVKAKLALRRASEGVDWFDQFGTGD